MQPIAEIMQKIAARYPGVTVIETAPLFCDAKACSPLRDGQVVFRDDNHVTPQGAAVIVATFPAP
jgi:hypothetical protein